jgi:hypothetical protein
VSYNGSGTFQINTSGQPVVAGTVISSTAFNALTADLATGLSTAITKDGQTTTTARIPFAAGINSSSATDSTSSSTGSIITSGGVGIAKALNVGSATDSSSISTGSIVTAGGVGVAKNLYVGVNANIAGTLDVTGAVTVTNPVINNIKLGYTTTATAAGTTTLTAASNHQQFFTGTLAQTIVLPVTSTLALGMGYSIENNSTGTLTVQSSGANTITTIPAGVTTQFTCILITGTTAASWDYDHIAFAAITGTGSVVLATSPTLVTPALGTPSALVLTNATGLPQAGLAANVAGNGPAFSAYANATQSLANATFVKIAIDTELFDTNSNFDSTTNYRFTPTVAGYYQINAGVLIGIGATGIAAAAIYKNGSIATLGNSAASDGSNAYSGVSTLLNLNGSTDYIELYGYQTSGLNKSTVAGSPYTYFQASLVRST